MADLESLLADTRYWADQGSDPSAPSAGQPVTYTKSGQLYLRNSSGIVGPLLDETAHDALDHTGLTGVGGGGSGGPTTVLLGTTRTSTSTSLADCTGLSFLLASGKHYVWQFFIKYQSAASTTGIFLSVNGPTYDTTEKMAVTSWAPVTGTAEQWNASNNGDGSTWDVGSAFTTGRTVPTMAYQMGSVFTTGAGTLILRFASEVGGSQVDIIAGSAGMLWTLD